MFTWQARPPTLAHQKPIGRNARCPIALMDLGEEAEMGEVWVWEYFEASVLELPFFS